MSALRVIFAAGGTGGHFYPALSLLEALRASGDVVALFSGTARGIEARVGPRLGLDLALADVRPLNGVRGIALAGALARIPVATASSLATVRRFRPDVVVSVGGYTAGPMALAAVALGVPLAVIEPNAVPGMTNRLVGRLAARAFVTYPETSRFFRAEAVRVTGTPIRLGFSKSNPTAADRVEVLVVGGSQGARVLNQLAPEALAPMLRVRPTMRVTHQTGPADEDPVAASYAAHGVRERVRVVPFIDDMVGAVGRASLVVARAGAATVAELTATGRAAIYVPYPRAADDHQRHNAEAVAQRGAGVCLLQPGLDAPRLARAITELIDDPPRLQTMSQAARAMGRRDAAADVARELRALTGH